MCQTVDTFAKRKANKSGEKTTKRKLRMTSEHSKVFASKNTKAKKWSSSLCKEELRCEAHTHVVNVLKLWNMTPDQIINHPHSVLFLFIRWSKFFQFSFRETITFTLPLPKVTCAHYGSTPSLHLNECCERSSDATANDFMQSCMRHISAVFSYRIQTNKASNSFLRQIITCIACLETSKHQGSATHFAIPFSFILASPNVFDCSVIYGGAIENTHAHTHIPNIKYICLFRS